MRLLGVNSLVEWCAYASLADGDWLLRNQTVQLRKHWLLPGR